MKYLLTLKNIKQSISIFGQCLKEQGYDIPKHVMFESFSKSLFFKNWNTLEGIATSPEQIKHYDVEKKYIFELQANIDKSSLFGLLKDCFKRADALFEFNDFLQSKNHYSFTIDMRKRDKNILTAMFLLCEELKNYQVEKFEFCRIYCEKESFMEYFKRPKEQVFQLSKAEKDLLDKTNLNLSQYEIIRDLNNLKDKKNI